MKIKPATTGFDVALSVSSPSGCTGSIEGSASLVNDVLTLTKKEDDQACTVTIKFSGDTAEVDENNCSYYHGAACGFSGTLNRQKRGKAPRPGIGIMVADQALTARAGIVGVVILGVTPNSPAAQGGLTPFDVRTGAVGDIIVAVNGQPVGNVTTFVSALDRAGIGNEAEFTVRRGDTERKVRVRIVDVS